MKFCPKCSLKIKGNVSQCPICKVELLSCAEDEEVTFRPLMEDDQEQARRATDHAVSTESNTQNVEPNVDSKEPTQKKAAYKTDTTEDYSDLNGRIKKLENAFKEMENKLSTILSQGDTFKSTAVDLESRITRADRALDEIKNTLGSPSDHNKNIEKEISRLTLNINHIIKDLENVKDKITNLEKPSSSSEARRTSDDFSSGKIEISDEGIRFPERLEDDFGEELYSQPEPEKKKTLLITILILVAIAISSWFGFNYFKSHNQESQKELITEEIKISPILKRDTEDTLQKITEIEPATKAQTEETILKPRETVEKLSLGEKQTPSTGRIAEEQPAPLRKSKVKISPSKKVSGYTVNVGSFKDKNLALALTKKLRDKGYSALMSLSRGKKIYRVRVGAFSSFKESISYAAMLEKKEKLPTYIAEINMP
ncbi:MAG: SPOR domain-containing protein [Deltaproteobacteria bacterium]|nr:SPOR domain-containing protein [Deltaproteobacteria bacterium]